jgi:hypothetical protein
VQHALRGHELVGSDLERDTSQTVRYGDLPGRYGAQEQAVGRVLHEEGCSLR